MHQSSSGIVVTAGTGATGWARSISLERGSGLVCHVPMSRPWPPSSARRGRRRPSASACYTEGLIAADESLEVVSELDAVGVIFGDGIESDALDFRWGLRATVRVARQRLRLVSAG